MKKFVRTARVLVLGLGFSALPHVAFAGSSPYLGEITISGTNFCKDGSQNANGQVLSVEQNGALYSLIKTHYGGDGRHTMQLPDMRGRYPAGASSVREIGKQEGKTHNNMPLPKHQHTLHGTSETGTTHTAEGTVFASPPTVTLPSGATVDLPFYADSDASQTVEFAGDSLSKVGSDTPPTNYAPSLGLTFCITTNGQYPTRP